MLKTHKNELDEMIDVVVKLTWNYTIFCALIEKKDADLEVRECEARNSGRTKLSLSSLACEIKTS